MAVKRDYHGSLIALEGPRDVLLTQCRLLPSSPNILVLPEFSQFMEPGLQDSSIDPSQYVLKAHEASNARAEKAFSFLRESTPNRRRLVFMIGGTAAAEKECILNIMEHGALADLAMADEIFQSLVRNGLGGLRRALDVTSNPESPQEPNAAQPIDQENWIDERQQAIKGHPIYEAMRAADELDRKTAALQPSTEVDLTIPSLRRSKSMPLHLWGDASSIADLRSNTSSSTSQQAPVPPLPPFSAQRVPIPTTEYLDDGSESAISDCAGDASTLCAQPSHDPLSPKSTTFDSAPATPIIIGEACLVDFRPLHSRLNSPYGAAKLVDCLYASTIRNQDISLCDVARPRSLRLDTHRDSTVTPQDKRNSWHGDPKKVPRVSRPINPRLRRGPPPPLDLTGSGRGLSFYGKWHTNLRDDYVHQAAYSKWHTNLRDDYVHQAAYSKWQSADGRINTEAFEVLPRPGTGFSSGDGVELDLVLPRMEDMVILFQGSQPDTLLKGILRDFQADPCRAATPVRDLGPSDRVVLKTSSNRNPPTQPSTPVEGRRPQASGKTAQERSNRAHVDEYDPFASHGEYPQNCYNRSRQSSTSTRVIKPPTPDHTPRRVVLPSSCFFEIDTTRHHTVIDVQDALRSVLRACFYSANTSPRQLDFPFTPELGGRDWQPVFRYKEPDFSGIHRREIDLILAIGAQEGVDKDFIASLRGSMETLGTKPNGVTQSGRLDLRYLIANALKTANAHLYSGPAASNLSANPHLIATLIIPSLETYMAIHSETRFLLLEYPPEHLATVLALRELVGDDILKVAGILNDKLEEPRPWPGQQSLDTCTPPPNPASGTGLFKSPSFSKADFVVTSSAAESEIATMISSVWKILVERSPFYIPDNVPKASAMTLNSRKGKMLGHSPSPLINLDIQYTPLDSAAAMMGFHGPTASYPHSNENEDGNSPHSRLPPESRQTQRPRSPLMSSASSFTETMRSSKTAKTIRTQRARLMNLLGRDLATDDRSTLRLGSSFAELSDDDDDDDEGEFAADERKYIPLFNKSEEDRKGNSRKALKFLGLSTEP